MKTDPKDQKTGPVQLPVSGTLTKSHWLDELPGLEKLPTERDLFTLNKYFMAFYKEGIVNYRN